MLRHAGWVVTALAFVALSFVASRSAAPEQLAWVSGNDLANPQQSTAHHGSEPLLGVRGVVDRVTTNSVGTRAIHLLADDGAPTVVVVMPSVDARIPGAGDRIAVAGRRLDSGVLAVEQRDQLTFLPPLHTSSERGHWIGRLVNRTRLPSGAHKASLMDGDALVMPCLVQRGVSLVGVSQQDTVIVTGYIGNDGTLVVARIDLADYN